MILRIYLSRWQEVAQETGKPLITDPIAQYLGADRVVSGLRRKLRIKAKPDETTKRPSKTPCVLFLQYDDGTDTSSIDSEIAGLPGVRQLEGATLSTRVDSLNGGQKNKVQSALDDLGIPVTLTDHETIGDALLSVALWLNPDLPPSIREGLRSG